MIQFAAVMLDSFRLLRSRSLFWLSLVLSALAAVALLGTYSFDADGLKVLWFPSWKNAMLREGTPGARDFVAFAFNSVYVKFWLTWGAMILALVSTASIMPDFLTGGSVELALARPISRVTLFAYKAMGALLFVLLQTSLGVGLAYLIIGFKFDLWLHPVLWAIPLITLQFFYLYAFSALIAVLTRSTLACVIGTMLIWFALFIVQFASNALGQTVETSRALVRHHQGVIERTEAKAAEGKREPVGLEQVWIARARTAISEEESTLRTFGPWARYLERAELLIPKTNDIQKIVAEAVEAPVQTQFAMMMMGGKEERHRPPGMDKEEFDLQIAADKEAEAAVRNVNAAKSIGSSLAASFAVLGIAAWMFRRRDY